MGFKNSLGHKLFSQACGFFPTGLYVFDGFVALIEADSLPLLGFVQISCRYHGQGHVDHVLLSTARWLVNECSHGLATDCILNQCCQIFFPCTQEKTVKTKIRQLLQLGNFPH